jgi:hypothetical protein
MPATLSLTPERDYTLRATDNLHTSHRLGLLRREKQGFTFEPDTFTVETLGLSLQPQSFKTAKEAREFGERKWDEIEATRKAAAVVRLNKRRSG